ncbi:MAG: hypothetical protein GY782_09150, partial [Gammaproteobacteria bacterium]|nr:hypothetical protein [Gammaproteobacteria bacterium]
VVKDKRFRRNFKKNYAKVSLEKENYDFPLEGFDQAFRPQCRHFLINFSRMRQQGRRDTVGFLSRCLGNAVSRFDWAEVSRLRESLMRYHREDTMGLVVRSRCQGRLEAEVASIYHLNQGVKRGKQGRLDKLAKEVNKGQKGSPSRILLEDRSQVEDEAVTFFTNLLQGFHKSADELGDSPFEPDFSDLDFFLKGLGRLTPEQAEDLVSEVTLSEVEDAIAESKNNKSPGFDGLTPEFYKAVSDLLGGDLVEVINDQLTRLVLMEGPLSLSCVPSRC